MKIGNVLLAALLSTGCANLSVETDVYRGTLPTPGTQPAQLDAVEASIRGALEEDPKLAKSLIKEYARVLDAVEVANQAKLSFREDLETQFKDAVKDLTSVRANLGQEILDEIERARSEPSQRQEIARVISSLLDQWVSKSREYGVTFEQLAGQYQQSWPSVGDTELKDAAKKLDKDPDVIKEQWNDGRAAFHKATGECSEVTSDSEAVASGFLTKEILTDPNFPRVVGAEEKEWSRHSNRVFNGGLFGNSQFAVVRESLGVFRLKSQTFDPEQLIAVIPSVTRAALRVAALTSGAPVGSSTDAGGGLEDQQVLESKAKLVAELDEARGETSALRIAHLQIVEKLLRLYGETVNQNGYPGWQERIKQGVEQASTDMRRILALHEAQEERKP